MPKTKSEFCTTTYVDIVPLPKSKQIKTFYPDDPERHHSQSFAGFKIHLARKSNKYIQNYFIPSGIMVIMSWVSFIFNITQTKNLFLKQYVISDQLCGATRGRSWKNGTLDYFSFGSDQPFCKLYQRISQCRFIDIGFSVDVLMYFSHLSSHN